MNRQQARKTIRLGLAGSIAVVGGCVRPPEFPNPIRSAPICSGTDSVAEQEAIDDLTTLLREDGLAIARLCDVGVYPPETAAAFAESGVNPETGKGGRFIVVHPTVAVTIYEWNADSTALLPILYAQAPADLNPCPNGWNWSGRFGYWRNDGRVEVVVNCDDPASLAAYPRLIFDPSDGSWQVDTQAGAMRTELYWFDPPINRVADGKVLAKDGNRYSVAFDSVFEVTAGFAVSALTNQIQNLRTGEVFELSGKPWLNPSGMRMAVDDHDSGVVRIYDLSGDAPTVILEIDKPGEWASLDGFAGERTLVATAKRVGRALPGLPASVTRYPLLIDSDLGEIFNASFPDLVGTDISVFETRVVADFAVP